MRELHRLRSERAVQPEQSVTGHIRMAEHTQGPGMGPEHPPTRGQRERVSPREPSIWSIANAGAAKNRRPGLDVLLTKAAVEFQNLLGEQREIEIKRDCE